MHLLFILSKKPFPLVPALFFQDAESFSPSLSFQDTISRSRCFPAPRHLFLSYDLNRENWRTFVERRPGNIFSTRAGTDLTGLKITTHLDLHEKHNTSSSASCKVLLICSPGIIICTFVYLHPPLNFSCFTPYINPRSS